jgi:hypothetical protein
MNQEKYEKILDKLCMLYSQESKPQSVDSFLKNSESTEIVRLAILEMLSDDASARIFGE